ncbi:hypothetical protein ACFQZO_13630 [Bradyrhizobium sp. GCM10027634]|uniref:hypothetical protein n=1 Tax=unclassified Bradyrhizobium TaxID=2631580 RepID=UPI00188BDEBE|nr:MULTISPECIES: hypothetical protein [unclassified Bradyrhizobium]MDN5001929.1 hypothetical protein [Bradyrhizobium sp. WYCCWR 12677]QOZ45786.1 hypothetical protein XH89_21590 [Bradyrhizobium sp. CCBAU 53340]
MESASVPEADDPKPETPKPEAPKPNEARADGGLARAFDQIKSAEQDLARLDRLVSGMEHAGDGLRASQASAGAKAAETPKYETSKYKATDSDVRAQGLKGDRPMLRALVGLVLAIGILGAAFASQYRDQAKSISKSIMARWVPPAASQPQQAAAVESPAQPPAVLLAAADQPTSVPAPPVGKETESAPKPDAPRSDAAKTGTTAPDQPSSDLAQSLKTITGELANINGKLEQLKSRNERALREQADTIQQLKAAQEKDAAENARLAAQVQALQTQLQTQVTSSSASAPAKPTVRSVNNETAAPARPHVQAAPPRRPRPPPRGPWMPPSYMDYGDPDW